jgi:hypothetical protein
MIHARPCPKVELTPVLEQLRGQVGDLVFKRYGDEVVISHKLCGDTAA